MNNRDLKKILIIAPLTPPYTGNALPVKYIFDKYNEDSQVTLVNLSKGSFKSGTFSVKRIHQILLVLFKVFMNSWNKDIIYLTIAESKFGNFRDILIYFFTLRKNSRTIIHLLGGNSMKGLLSNKKSIWFWLNKIFISRLGAVIVEGQFQADYFKNVINENRIHIIPNFAQKFLFSNPNSIIKKFEDIDKIKVLFLSNLLFGKGHYELLDAFKALSKNERDFFEINFGGGFESDKEKDKFIKLIQPYSQLNYLGHVGGEKKAELFQRSHLFCLPTYYPFEGQPFVIVEAYAAGCAVITTNHSGIPYIFKDKLNGILVEKKSAESLREILTGVCIGKFQLKDFALYNFNEASKIYTEEKYLEKVISIFKKVSEKA